jgi:excisionase family DNA binding protein
MSKKATATAGYFVKDLPRSQDRRASHIAFFTIAQVADRFQVSPRTVRRWIANDDLVAHHFGTAVRIADRDLAAFIALRRAG